MLAQTSFAKLDAHERRREQGIPTVSTLLGEAEYNALDCVYAWCSARAIAVVSASLDPIESFRRWFVAALKGEEPLLLLARPISLAIGSTVTDVLNRLLDDAINEMPKQFRDAFPFDAATMMIVEAMRAHGSAETIANDLVARFDNVRLSAVGYVSATLALLTPDPGPALVFTQASSEGLQGQISLASALAEAAPTLRVFLTTSKNVYKASIPREEEHAHDLIRESLIWLDARLASAQPNVAALINDARRLRDDVPPQPDAARSAAERALFAALQAHSTTTGKFELNGKIDAMFGNRAAEIDLLAREHKVAIEVDGYYHFQDAANYRRDRRKDILMQSEGYFVIRILADDVIEHLDDVMSTIIAVVTSKIKEV